MEKFEDYTPNEWEYFTLVVVHILNECNSSVENLLVENHSRFECSLGNYTHFGCSLGNYTRFECSLGDYTRFECNLWDCKVVGL